MAKHKRKALIKKAEELGWKCAVDENGGVEFSKYSPAGEDFCFEVRGKDIAAEVEEYYEDFDPDEHVEMWVRARETVSGVPPARVLAKDADDIDKMLEELSRALCAVEV